MDISIYHCPISCADRVIVNFFLFAEYIAYDYDEDQQNQYLRKARCDNVIPQKKREEVWTDILSCHPAHRTNASRILTHTLYP